MAKERLLTSAQLADEIGLARRTISRYASEGLLIPALVTPGGHYRWRVEDVRVQLEEIARKNRENRP